MANERRLKELAALSQIYGNLNGDAAQARKMQAAIQLLGLQQQTQEAKQRNDILKSEVAQREAAASESADNRFFDTMAGRPDVPIETLLKFAPQNRQHQVQAMHDASVVASTRQLMPTIQALYGTHANDPIKLRTALAGIEPTVPEAVWNGVPWDQLNAALPQQQAPTPNVMLRASGLEGPSVLEQGVGEAAGLGGRFTGESVNKFLNLLGPLTYPFRQLNAARKTPAGKPLPKIPVFPEGHPFSY